MYQYITWTFLPYSDYIADPISCFSVAEKVASALVQLRYSTVKQRQLLVKKENLV